MKIKHGKHKNGALMITSAALPEGYEEISDSDYQKAVQEQLKTQAASVEAYPIIVMREELLNSLESATTDAQRSKVLAELALFDSRRGETWNKAKRQKKDNGVKRKHTKEIQK